MNLIDAIVRKVIAGPHKLFDYDMWVVPVEYEDEGGKGITNLHFNTLDEAAEVKPGYIFQH